MSDREDRLRSLLDKVRAKRPAERTTRAGDAVERIRTASGTTAAASAAPSSPPVPSALPTQAAPAAFQQVPASQDPPTTPGIDSPTRYSSQPPRVERPLSSKPATRISRPSSGSMPAARSSRPEAIRPQSVSPSAQPIVVSSDAPEFPRAKSFGDLLELTLSLRPK